MTPPLAHAGADEVRAAPNRTLFILALGALAYTLAQTMIVPALPAIQRELHTSAADVTWLLTAFLLAASIATPIVGRLGDMYGKERLLLFALLLFGAGNLIAAFGHSLGVYIAGRAVQGAGGAILPLAIGIIRDEFPREKVATGIGTISAMFGIGGGVGLVISGVLVDHLGIDSIFWLGVIASVIAAAATWRYVPESPVRVQARIDYGGAALLTATLLALLLGVSEGNSWGWTSPRILGLFAAAIVFGAIWAWFELRTEDPLVDLRLMRERAMWTVNLSAFAIGFAMFGSYILIPQLVQTPTSSGYGFGASVMVSGIYLLPSALLMLFSGPLSGPDLDEARLAPPADARHDRRRHRLLQPRRAARAAVGDPRRQRDPRPGHRPLVRRDGEPRRRCGAAGDDRRGERRQHDRALDRRRDRRPGRRRDPDRVRSRPPAFPARAATPAPS